MTTYLTGLPVGIDVRDDGSVHLTIYAEDIAAAILEDEEADEATARDDADIAASAWSAGRVTTSSNAPSR